MDSAEVQPRNSSAPARLSALTDDASSNVSYDALSNTPYIAEPELTTDHVLVPVEVLDTRPGEYGVFATEPITAGTICVVFGGYVTPGSIFRSLNHRRQQHSLQVGDDLYLVCGSALSTGDRVNHSCNPSLAFIGEISLCARHDIAVGEQLTFDYATCDSTPYDEFECECGSSICRVKVTGEDWMRPDLQERYAGNFSPYLERRIGQLRF